MGILYVKKPKGITSFDLCFKLRKVLGTKKIGHTGTLDPNATGLMIVLYGNDTKANQFLVADKKEYIGKCLLGVETDTLDIDGQIIRQEDLKMPTQEQILEVFKLFVGTYLQTPPMTSAIKVNGKKLYEYQREGKTIEVEKREVSIYSLDLLSLSEKEFIFRCEVSSGTYIRSLLKDILDKLNVFGTLQELERTKINDVSLQEADSLEDILNGNFKEHSLYEVLSKRLKPIVVLNAQDVKNGKRLRFDSNEDELFLVDKNNSPLAIYRRDGLEYKCVRGLF